MVVVDAEVWELKLPRLLMAGYSWEGCPAAGGLYGCCRCARARVRRAVPRAPACDKLRCERLELILVSGLDVRDWGCRAREVLGDGWRGGVVRTRCVAPVVEALTTPRATPPSAPTTLLLLK